MRAARIRIDQSRCGGKSGIDPRACCRCLQACAPAVFIMHETFGVVEKDPLDPQAWSVTVMWPTLCTKCMKCAQVCPQNAIAVR